jgi:hypothetical protein
MTVRTDLEPIRHTTSCLGNGRQVHHALSSDDQAAAAGVRIYRFSVHRPRGSFSGRSRGEPRMSER